MRTARQRRKGQHRQQERGSHSAKGKLPTGREDDGRNLKKGCFFLNKKNILMKESPKRAWFTDRQYCTCFESLVSTLLSSFFASLSEHCQIMQLHLELQLQVE
jgi:hypothetical protein